LLYGGVEKLTREEGFMKVFIIVSLSMAILWTNGEAWSQKSPATVRFGVAGVSGTNAHYYVDRQLGLFRKNNRSRNDHFSRRQPIDPNRPRGRSGFINPGRDPRSCGQSNGHQFVVCRRCYQYFSVHDRIETGDPHSLGFARQKNRHQPLGLRNPRSGAVNPGTLRSQAKDFVVSKRGRPSMALRAGLPTPLSVPI
jgi:hypothetical protein